MKTLLRNIFAPLLGVILGGVINMAIVVFGSVLIPPPQGVDVTDAQSLRESMHLFGPQHFLVPFVAHAVGTLAGALIAFLVAVNYRIVFAYVVGAFFLVGGIAAAFMIPAPWWFITLDIVAAYIPMAWIAIKVGNRLITKADISVT